MLGNVKSPYCVFPIFHDNVLYKNYQESIFENEDAIIYDPSFMTYSLPKGMKVFRKYSKKGEHFMAEDDYYVFHNNLSSFQNMNSPQEIIYFDPNRKLFFQQTSETLDHDMELSSKQYLDLYVIDQINISQEKIKITRQELIYHFAENQQEMDEKLLHDLYFDFSYKIPTQNLLQEDHQSLTKIYLFACDIKQSLTPRQSSVL